MNFKLTRILASLIDGLVMLILLVAMCIAPSLNLAKGIMNDNYVMGDILWLIFSFIGSVLVWILYLSLTGLIFKNATLGMKIMRLAFIKTNGTEVMFLNIFEALEREDLSSVMNDISIILLSFGINN